MQKMKNVSEFFLLAWNTRARLLLQLANVYVKETFSAGEGVVVNKVASVKI